MVKARVLFFFPFLFLKTCSASISFELEEVLVGFIVIYILVIYPFNVLLDLGELYTWGRDEGDGRLGLGPNRGPNEGGGLSIPSKVKELPIPVTAVFCGGFFTMALTEQGQLWNWGGENISSFSVYFYFLYDNSSRFMCVCMFFWVLKEVVK